jgi:preprotein translocase SecF subunit
MKLLRIVPDNTKFPFMRFRRVSFPFSAFLSIASVVLFLWAGMNVGIDFKGGTLIEMKARQGVADLADLRAKAGNFGFGEVELQNFGSPQEVLIRVALQAGGEAAQQVVVKRFRDTFEAGYEFRRVEAVGPRVAAELVQNGTIGVIVAVLAIWIYLWFRFEWQFGVAAIISLIHDTFAVLGFMALTEKTFDLSTLAAVLMVAGFSINDTVVIFDRIREMMRKYRKKPLGEVCNMAINGTLSRTVMTSMLTLLALVALWVFGGEVIQGFVDALLFGFLVGTYSSVYVAASLLLYLGLRTGYEEKPV